MEKFFEILRAGLGLTARVDVEVSADEWTAIYGLAKKQALLGVMFAGAERLPASSYPPEALMMQWLRNVMVIRRQNAVLDSKCREVISILASIGYDSCILKGQGVAQLYPDPGLRQSGDIDIWVRKRGSDAHDISISEVRELINKVKALGIGTLDMAVYHHVGWSIQGCEVEIHYRPAFFNTPWIDRRFQRWCTDRWGERVDIDGIIRPSKVFNAVYLLVHIYRHLLNEGVGLRQVVDYVMLLQRCDFSTDDRAEIRSVIDDLGLMRCARGLMWIVKEYFNISTDRLIVEADGDEGRFLLDEIMEAGNFGQYDPRIDRSQSHTTAGKFLMRTRHRMRFVMRYPMEVICDIPFRFYNYAWRVTLKLGDACG